MTRRERLLRAASAITGGLLLALDHLRGDTPGDDEPDIPLLVAHPCPMCPGSLAEGPHFHGADVFWMGERGSILLTDRAGGDTFVIGGAE